VQLISFSIHCNVNSLPQSLTFPLSSLAAPSQSVLLQTLNTSALSAAHQPPNSCTKSSIFLKSRDFNTNLIYAAVFLNEIPLCCFHTAHDNLFSFTAFGNFLIAAIYPQRLPLFFNTTELYIVAHIISSYRTENVLCFQILPSFLLN